MVIRGEALELVVANQIPTPAPAATTTAAEMTAGFLVNHFLRFGPTDASLAPRPPADDRVETILWAGLPSRPQGGRAIQSTEH